MHYVALRAQCVRITFAYVRIKYVLLLNYLCCIINSYSIFSCSGSFFQFFSQNETNFYYFSSFAIFFNFMSISFNVRIMRFYARAMRSHTIRMRSHTFALSIAAITIFYFLALFLDFLYRTFPNTLCKNIRLFQKLSPHLNLLVFHIFYKSCHFSSSSMKYFSVYFLKK